MTRPRIERIVKQLLERLVYHAKVYAIFLEAFAAFRANSEKYDLVISNMAMPNMSGVRTRKAGQSTVHVEG